MRISITKFFRRATGPMPCDEVGRWLQHYLDEELDERRSRRLSAHLEECARCGLEADAYSRIKDALADCRDEVPADSLSRLREFSERLVRGDVPEAL